MGLYVRWETESKPTREEGAADGTPNESQSKQTTNVSSHVRRLWIFWSLCRYSGRVDTLCAGWVVADPLLTSSDYGSSYRCRSHHRRCGWFRRWCNTYCAGLWWVCHASFDSTTRYRWARCNAVPDQAIADAWIRFQSDGWFWNGEGNQRKTVLCQVRKYLLYSQVYWL